MAARTKLPVQDLPVIGGAPLQWTAADTTNGHYITNDGYVVLLVSGGGTVTVESVADAYGRKGDLSVTSVAAGDGAPGGGVFNLLPTHLFNQGGGSQANINVTGTGVMLAAVRTAPRR